MDIIKILKGGLFTTVQDKGRIGYQQFGVPVSGTMDGFAHRISNLLVGNDEFEAVLEATIIGPHIEFSQETVIAITGGDLNPMVNGESIQMWKSTLVKKGDVLSFGTVKTGCRAYISFRGGIDVPKVMGSKSTYTKGHIGGVEGRQLKEGDILSISDSLISKNTLGITLPKEFVPVYEREVEVSIILGPQDDYFTSQGIETFLLNAYTVTNEFDRMGYRLEGENIEHKQGSDIISDGIALGAIQVPSHGRPIIMMADRQTVGGYTKIANVISADLYKIAQAKAGDIIKFRSVDILEAHQRLKEREAIINLVKNYDSARDIISVRQFRLRIDGKQYNVRVDEMKTS